LIHHTPKQEAFTRAQQADSEPKSAFEKAKTGKNGYLLQNGILFKKKP
jgi:hypothetical protein